MKTNLEKFDEGYVEISTLFDGLGDTITHEEMSQKIVDFGKDCGLDMSVCELTNREKEERIHNMLMMYDNNRTITEMHIG